MTLWLIKMSPKLSLLILSLLQLFLNTFTVGDSYVRRYHFFFNTISDSGGHFTLPHWGDGIEQEFGYGGEVEPLRIQIAIAAKVVGVLIVDSVVVVVAGAAEGRDEEVGFVRRAVDVGHAQEDEHVPDLWQRDA